MRQSLPGSLALMAMLSASPALSATPPAASFDSRFAAARSLALSGERVAAIEAYSALLVESPDNSDVLVGRGRVYAWQDRWAESEQDLLAATRSTPRDTDAWSALGDLYLWSGRPAESVAAYSRWIDLSPGEGDAWAARGRAHRAADQRDDARSDFEAAGIRGMEVKSLLASLEPPAPADVRAVTAAESQLAGSRPVEVVIPDQYRWTAGLSIDREHFRGNGTNWIDSTLILRRQWDVGSLGLEVLDSRRFAITDRAYAVDAYVKLWPRATLNWRMQIGETSRLFPHDRLRAELFQGVGAGWEVSGGYDRLGFSTPVEILSLGLGRYVGNWYVRLRSQYVPGTVGDPSASYSGRLTTRYYYRGDADNYLELTGGLGNSEPATTTTGPATANRHSASIGVAWAGKLTARTGFKLSYSNGYGYESQASHNDGLSGSVYTRW